MGENLIGTASGIASGIKVTDVAFVRFRAPDLDLMEQFLTDFGLHRSERTETALYMRGAGDEGFVHVTELGDEPEFIGMAFDAASIDDLEVLAGRSDFSDISELDGPGGGGMVSATDPNGFQVEVVAGRRSVGTLESVPQLEHNDAAHRPRRDTTIRLVAGPSHVQRLGHVVINVIDFRESEAWYKERFGLITSDEIAIDETRSLGAFMRCDRGPIHVDHHTLFCVGRGAAGFNHAAFEVADLDDLMAGHTHLQNAAREHQWGVGRHILGSQIYDYWRDPYGHMIEHWTDGDLFDSDVEPNVVGVPDLLGSQWGPMLGGPPG
ncbi:MAG: VOC family protein [Ilumatobacter sp.]